MAEEEQSKRPAGPRAETMQSEEVKARLTPHYLPDYGRSFMARDAEHAVKLAKRQAANESDGELTEDKEDAR